MTNLPVNAIRFPKRNIRLVRKDDCQGEAPRHIRLMDQLKAVKAGLASGFTAAEIRRYECDRSTAIIKREAEALALFETPVFAADALRKLADEIESGDAA